MRFLTACGAFALHVAFLAFAASGGVTLPITFSHGHIMVPARVDDSGPLSFMLDSGYSLTMLHPAHASDFNLRRTGGITIVGIAGEERADVFAGPAFDFGGAIWTPRRVAAYPPTSAQARRKRDPRPYPGACMWWTLGGLREKEYHCPPAFGISRLRPGYDRAGS